MLLCQMWFNVFMYVFTFFIKMKNLLFIFFYLQINVFNIYDMFVSYLTSVVIDAPPFNVHVPVTVLTSVVAL